MDSYVLFHFAVARDFEVDGQKSKRVYQFAVQPGSPWEEIESAFEEFKAEFSKLKDESIAAEAAKKDSESSEEVVDAEVVA